MTPKKSPVNALWVAMCLASSVPPVLASSKGQTSESPPEAGQITNDTVLFNFRGESIKAGHLPGRSLSCRMYVAKRLRMSFGSAFKEEWGRSSFYNPVGWLSRITMQVVFAEDWKSADVWSQSETYRFKPLKFNARIPFETSTHNYDRLKMIDPERSTQTDLRERAKKALKKKEVSKVTGVLNLQLRFAPLTKETVSTPALIGNAIHIYDRMSDPKFYLRIGETGSQINDEWLPQLMGDQHFLVGRVVPTFDRSVARQVAIFLLMPTAVGAMVAPIDWSNNEGINVGSYCYVGAPSDLDIYESKPLGRAARGL